MAARTLKGLIMIFMTFTVSHSRGVSAVQMFSLPGVNRQKSLGPGAAVVDTSQLTVSLIFRVSRYLPVQSPRVGQGGHPGRQDQSHRQRHRQERRDVFRHRERRRHGHVRRQHGQQHPGGNHHRQQGERGGPPHRAYVSPGGWNLQNTWMYMTDNWSLAWLIWRAFAHCYRLVVVMLHLTVINGMS